MSTPLTSTALAFAAALSAQACTPDFAPTANAESGRPSTEAQVHCRVDTHHDARGDRLEAIIESGRGLAGRFDLTVLRRGPAGTSEIRQSGEFAVDGGGFEPVATILVGPNDAATAVDFRVFTARGETICTTGSRPTDRQDEGQMSVPMIRT